MQEYPPAETSNTTTPQSGLAFPAGATQGSELAAIMAAAVRLAQLEDRDNLLHGAVEFVRDTLNIERVGFFLVQVTDAQIVMHGTWGTDDRGRTFDERGLAHCFAQEDFEALRELHRHGALWLYRPLKPQDTDRRRTPSTREDREWLAMTPLIAAREVVGLVYNDTAISKAPLDSTKQTNLAVFGTLLASLAQDRLALRGANPWSHVVPKTSRFIQKVLFDLEREPQLSGEQLAQRFRVSSGHLARTFKAEVGTSLVEYRNRLRFERYFTIMQDGQHTVLEAALEAGFGSYAQFHRVRQRVTGAASREDSLNEDESSIR